MFLVFFFDIFLRPSFILKKTSYIINIGVNKAAKLTQTAQHLIPTMHDTEKSPLLKHHQDQRCKWEKQAGDKFLYKPAEMFLFFFFNTF